MRLTNPFWMTRTDGSFEVPGRGFHIASGLLSGSVKPLISIARLRISATCWSVTGWPSSLEITSVSGSVRNPGKVRSNSSCATRTGLSGGRYFSLMPPSARFPSGMIITTKSTTIGAANKMGRFITRLTNLPQNPLSTSSRVLVFWVLSATHSMMFRDTDQLRRNGTLSRVRTPSASTFGPRMARMAASTVIDNTAASMTEAMMA